MFVLEPLVADLERDISLPGSLLVIGLGYLFVRSLRQGLVWEDGEFTIRGVFWTKRWDILAISRFVVGEYWGPIESFSTRLASVEVLFLDERQRTLSALSGRRERVESLVVELNQTKLNYNG